MTLRKTVSASALAVLLSLCLLSPLTNALAVGQAEIDALQAERDELTEKLDELRGEIESLEGVQSSILEKKAALDRQSELTRQEIEIVGEQIDMYASLIENKAKELTEAEAEERVQYERYRGRLRAMEENGKLGYISVIFQASSFADLLARLDFIGEILEYDKKLGDSYVAAVENTRLAKEGFETAKLSEELAAAELAGLQDTLDKQIEQAVQLIASLEDDIVAYTALYEENAAIEAELNTQINSLIAKLEAERAAAERAAAERAAAERAANAPGGSAGSGTLMWPVYGGVSSYYGNRMHPILNYERFHSGIDISAGSGTPIAASDGGTVAIATYSESYGNYIMLNHGNGVYTVYAHMSSMAVSAGQSVSKGQVIGYVGSTGLSNGPHLHFEVRKNGSTVDPLSYL